MPTLRAVTDVETILIGSVCNSQQMFSKRAPQEHTWMPSLACQPHRVSDRYSVFSYKLTWGLWKHPTISVSWRSLWMSVCRDPQIILGHLEHTGPGARDIWSTSISLPLAQPRGRLPFAAWAALISPRWMSCCQSPTHFTQSMELLFWGQKGLHFIALPLFHPLYKWDINL